MRPPAPQILCLITLFLIACFLCLFLLPAAAEDGVRLSRSHTWVEELSFS